MTRPYIYADKYLPEQIKRKCCNKYYIYDFVTIIGHDSEAHNYHEDYNNTTGCNGKKFNKSWIDGKVVHHYNLNV